MQVDISELKGVVTKVSAAVENQSIYVGKLAELFNEGQTVISLCDTTTWGTTWVDVPLKDWWELNQALYLEQAAFLSTLNSTLTAAQSSINTALVGVVVPPMNGVVLS